MLDFFRVATRNKKDSVEVYPKFIINFKTKDLMIKGGDFYAVWDEDRGIWSKSEQSVVDQVDRAIDQFIAARLIQHPNDNHVGLYMNDGDAGSIDRWHKYVQKQMRDCFVPLDEKLIFSNQEVRKTDYVSKTLPYPLEEGDISAYDELIGTLYEPEERAKLEWAIGAVISGDAKRIQKFEVLYGDQGTGKGTILSIIEKLFAGFTSTFVAKDLGSSNNSFALESFKDNPLVSIQFDGDLSRIEDNTKLNSITSHESIEVNAKYTKIYTTRFNTFLFMGTNKPVKITDAKSGILRRLIDVNPSGKKVPYKKYHQLKNQLDFELGAIAYHCLKVYEEMGEDYYENYIPTSMMSATNDFYDFVDHTFDIFKEKDMVTQSEAWALYKEYCDFAGARQMPLRVMKLELRNYFKEFTERGQINGKPVRNLYSGFLAEKFVSSTGKTGSAKDEPSSWLVLKEIASLFDAVFASSKAQQSNADGNPSCRWANCETVLSEIDTKREHWVKPDDPRLICIDFDIRGRDGVKNFEANVEAASKWPKTYAETSRSGKAIHLYYYYTGDVSKLSSVFDDQIEVKVFTGNSSLRRKVTLCNDIPIAELKPGKLPLKGDKKVVNWDGIKNEKMLRAMILKNLRKEYHPDTSSSIDYIKHLLDEAYKSGMSYDVSDMHQAVLLFAMKSTNQSDRCVNAVSKMQFKSEEISEPGDDEPKDGRLVFFDCEVYPNFFGIVWKYDESPTCVHMVNPTPKEVEELFYYKLVGFNCRQYDNHILYARSLGYSNEDLYKLSQQMIVSHSGFLGEAYNLSYTDIYDFCTEKKSLKKWEIELGIHHQEMGIPWDEPVPDDKINEVMEYCENDVRATEALFHARRGDFIARQIQVDLVKLLHGDEMRVTVNDTTNTLSKRIIFGNNRHPQTEFNYRDLSKPVGSNEHEKYVDKFGPDYKFRVFNADGLPEYRDYIPGETLPDGWSILPFFKGYTFDQYASKDKSKYLDEVIGEGGRVYSVKGYYEWVWDGDISSQHPHSIIAEVLFGPRYTKVFQEIVEARVAVKHKDFENASKALSGALGPYLKEETYKDLAQALKIVVNSIYGLTKASFSNEFRDPRNIDNIVAKRGALFMTLLKREVEKRGFMVCHIKTDSIKIPHATDDIREFVVKFGREFGYEFETEGVFDKFALFNDAAYIAHDIESGEWITKADQFKKEKQPYLYKTLFSHEPYEFTDFCQTKSVTQGALYLDMNEDLGEPVDDLYVKESKKLDKLSKKFGVTKEELEKQRDICEKLKAEIPTHHDYRFVGRVGEFTPMKEGSGGGVLYRVQDGRYYAASGTTGYRWLESENVKKYGKVKDIDKSFYTKLVDEAMDDIREIVDPEFFLSDAVPDKVLGPTIDISKNSDPIPEKQPDGSDSLPEKQPNGNDPLPGFMNIPEDAPEELPWEEVS